MSTEQFNEEKEKYKNYFVITRNKEDLSSFYATINDTPDGRFRVIITGERNAILHDNIYDTIEEANGALINSVKLYSQRDIDYEDR